jgi:predicted site-specific integrase-resolvase
MTQHPVRAAIYVRVSLEDGRQTVENQRQQLAEFCQRMNWKVACEFHDNKSGKSLDRPGFKRMITAASRKEYDVLVFWDLSRLSRGGVVEVLNVLATEELGCCLQIATGTLPGLSRAVRRCCSVAARFDRQARTGED